MYAANRFVTFIAGLAAASIVGGCATIYQTVGPYEVVVKSGSLLCQPRPEFYFTGSSSGSKRERTYLGACGTPQGLIRDLNLSISTTDRSCFAIAEDRASMVYLHNPRICGGGEKAALKPGGVYLHSVREGDRLLYPESQINQVWSTTDIGQHAIMVHWIGRTPSRSGAICSQYLVINANGEETPEGRADLESPFCRNH